MKRRFQLGALLLEAPLGLDSLPQERWSIRGTLLVIERACFVVMELVEVSLGCDGVYGNYPEARYSPPQSAPTEGLLVELR